MRPEWETAARAAWQTAGRPEKEAAFVSAFLACVEAAYPPATQLGRKFDFFWYTYELRLAGLTPVDATAAAEAERQHRARDEASRAQVETRIAEALDQSMAGYRQQVAEAFGAVLDHVASGKALRQGAVERLISVLAGTTFY